MNKCPKCGSNVFNIGIEKSAKGTLNDDGNITIEETINIEVVTIECDSCGEMIDRSEIEDIFGM